MSPGILYGGVSIDIGEETQTESVIVVVWRICEPIDYDGVVLGVVDLPHPAVELVVGDAAPVFRLLVIVIIVSRTQFHVERPWGQRLFSKVS